MKYRAVDRENKGGRRTNGRRRFHYCRLELVPEPGATEVINTSHQDLTAVLEAVGGIDQAIDTTGVPAMISA